MQKALNIFVAVFVTTIMAIVLLRLFNSDTTGKPGRQVLMAEMSRLRPLSGMADVRYVDKLTYIYVTAKGPVRGGSPFHVDPTSLGWSFKSRRAYVDGEVIRYCRGRLALSIDTNPKKQVADFGIDWTSDRGSERYCATEAAR